jgi:spermidine synthase
VIPLAVTVCGAAVMCLEMMAFRILPPNFGSSLYVWGSIISVFLTGLTLGYFFGGLAADRWPRFLLLGIVVFLAGLLVPPIPHYQQALAEWTLRQIPAIQWGSLLYAFLLFAPSTILLGTVSPIAVRLTSREVHRVGNVAGRLYALSTAGSIFGTLFTAFYWMNFSGVRAITGCVGWVLVALGAFLLVVSALRDRIPPPPARVGAALGAALLMSPSPTQAQSRVLYRKDTMYHHIVVQDTGAWRELKFDRSSQSGILRSDPLRSMFAYTDGFHLARVYCPGMKRVLFIGCGAATGPKQFRSFYPELQMDVVEIDPEVVSVAKRFFSFAPDARTSVSVQDGRRFLVTTRNQYDVIIVDAYYAESIPFHVTTVEFMQLLKRRLNPGGVGIFNVIGSVTGPDSKLVRSEYKTIRQVFRSCGYFPILEVGEQPNDYSPTNVRNVILVASEQPLAPAEVRRRAAGVKNQRLPHLLPAAEAFTGKPLPTGDVPLLSDDFAPVDRLIPIP